MFIYVVTTDCGDLVVPGGVAPHGAPWGEP